MFSKMSCALQWLFVSYLVVHLCPRLSSSQYTLILKQKNLMHFEEMVILFLLGCLQKQALLLDLKHPNEFLIFTIAKYIGIEGLPSALSKTNLNTTFSTTHSSNLSRAASLPQDLFMASHPQNCHLRNTYDLELIVMHSCLFILPMQVTVNFAKVRCPMAAISRTLNRLVSM